jgi:hypothetical protein
MDEPAGFMDMFLRLTLILFFIGWNVFEGLSLRTPYPGQMVVSWESPLWRFALLLAVWLGAEWCPRVGLMTGLAVVMYIANMIQIV